MKKLLLFLALIAGHFLNAQVGIGTDTPSPSAQLDIISSNRGVLIPQIPLTGVTDQTTISAGNVESLLVYNTRTNTTLTPGYYYWYQNRWQRIIVEADFPDNMVRFDVLNSQLIYDDVNGVTQTINLGADVLTNLRLNADGYTLEYTDENSVLNTINLQAIIQNQETTTTLVNGNSTTVASTPNLNNTEFRVNVNTASGTSLGVVREAAVNPTVKINAQGELSVDYTNLNTIVETNVAYTVRPNDAIILGDANAGDVDITLPAATASNRGKKITIKKEDTNEDHFVTIIGTIAGVTELYTALPYSGWELISDGTEWKIINKF